VVGTVEIRPLVRNDDRRGFSSGQHDLDRFFDAGALSAEA
jgi:hypothetical protein